MKIREVISWIGLFGSLAVGMILTAIGYPLPGLVIAFAGALISAVCMRRMRAIGINDEREQFVWGKTCILTVMATLPVFTVVSVVITVLSIDIPATAVLVPLYILYVLTFALSYNHYDRRYR